MNDIDSPKVGGWHPHIAHFFIVISHGFTLVFRSFFFPSCHVLETVEFFADERVHVFFHVDGVEAGSALLSLLAFSSTSFLSSGFFRMTLKDGCHLLDT